MDAFLGKWISDNESRKNQEEVMKSLEVSKEDQKKFAGSHSIEYSKDGDNLSAHVCVENMPDKTYRYKLGVENEVDGMDNKKYMVVIKCEGGKIIETSKPKDGRPNILTERSLEGNNKMMVKITVGSNVSTFTMSKQ